MSGAPEADRPAADAEALDRLRIAALIPALRRSYTMSVTSIAVFSVLLAHTSPVGLLTWLVVRAAVTAWSLWRLSRLDADAAPTSATLRILTWMLLIGGATWGLIPFLVRPGEQQWQAVVVLWLFGNQSVVTAVCAPHRRVFLAAIGSVTVVGAAGLLTHGSSFSGVLAALLVLGGAYSVSVFRAMHGATTAGMSSQIETARLAASLGEANRRLEQLSATDELTMVMNRRRFREAVANTEGTLREPGAVLILDVDRFKTINDGLGHQVGDVVLATLATRWAPLIEPAGFLARFGGDEFACFLAGASQHEAEAIAEALRDAASAPILWGGPAIRTTCSVGVALADAGTPLTRALAAADAALYDAKRSGRDAVSVAQRTA